ncbi:MAG TPA: PEP phosphonomutase [Clostridiaceae bacterium]|jgi:putative N-acetylmannosamine-6-phosphate epimerase|nr:PEP phosphonomutase [Clostridiaceae bacterium]HBN28756.1 PEP phosphonomutase [Clostridiaceae bacterium]
MVKRILDCTAKDFMSMTKDEILESIAAAEGRTIVSELICGAPSLYSGVSNAEIACAFGSDILLLNMFDVNNPYFIGIERSKNVISEIKRLTGRLVGINLEPVDAEAETFGEIKKMQSGRLATAENAEKAYKMGANFIVLTGNPGTGVSNRKITSSLKSIRSTLKDNIVLIAGKMHAAGSLKECGKNIITKDDIKSFVSSGADIILIPAPGTVPGITLEYVCSLVDYCHSLNALTMTSIGTSQEGSDVDTIKQIALMCKMTGTDIHHIGDSGYTGIAIPENIMEYSIAIRGKRHTYIRMARSLSR